MGELMKSVRDSGSEGWMGSGGGTGDDTAMGMAEGEFAKALALGGGLGIAQMIEKTMNPQRPQPQNVNAALPKGSAVSWK